uniref:Matrix protein M2-2 n=2 Tax=murine pneumonia virus TaxID=11263 RepID=F1DFI2_9MONO|nr:matrix protein M2-2 [Pneumovirus dog/Ane4/USA/2008]ADZ31996.1 matrix protein M2-2 [Pneumovirus dog/Brne17/USA/2008]
MQSDPICHLHRGEDKFFYENRMIRLPKYYPAILHKMYIIGVNRNLTYDGSRPSTIIDAGKSVVWNRVDVIACVKEALCCIELSWSNQVIIDFDYSQAR